MRLLHFNNVNKLVLTDFTSKSIPPYAILSHRWSDDEVLFQHIGDDSYETKLGFRKIEFCAKQAIRDNLDYFWIDTCCINKWNVHELSKSINSMFRWYQSAARCYVLLDDISLTTADVKHEHVWETSFRQSVWFTRGWTLQELIAPSSVEFFSREGDRLGDKVSLEDAICAATDIPVDALRNHPLENFTPEERMTWVQFRATTEPEDRVYCVLGILGVQMPVTYGEGEAKARERLHHEMISSDIPSHIPYARNLQFTGREVELAEVQMLLFQGQHKSVVAIFGEAGSGKSQLALEVAYLTRERHQDCMVFWLDASDPARLREGYVTIAQKLQIPGRDRYDADLPLFVKNGLNKHTKRWLLLLDGVKDVSTGSGNILHSRTTNIVDLLPQSGVGSIIITSTNKDAANVLSKQNALELKEMTPTVAATMFLSHLGRPLSVLETHDMPSMLERLQYSPLAVVHAATCIKIAGMLLSDYHALLVQKWRDLSSKDIVTSRQTSEDNCSNLAIVATSLVSMDQVRRDDALAADFLQMIACIDGKDVPLDFLKVDSWARKERAITLLQSYGLITRRPAESAVDVHRLVHQTIHDWLQKQQHLHAMTASALEQLTGIFPDDDPRNRSQWRRLLPHAERLLSTDVIDKHSAFRVSLSRLCARAMRSDGQWNKAEHFFLEVMNARIAMYGTEHPSTLVAMGDVAMAELEQGRYIEAEEQLKRIAASRENIFGAEDPETLLARANIVLPLINQGRLQEAEEILAEVVAISKTVLGLDHSLTLKSSQNLATIYRQQGRYPEAEQLDAAAMRAVKATHGLEHPDTLVCMSNYAITLRSLGRRSEAEQLLVTALETSTNTLGPSHATTLKFMTNLASLYEFQDRLDEAEEMLSPAMETCKTAFGLGSSNTLSAITTLALIFCRKGRSKEFEQMRAQIMEFGKAALSDGLNVLERMHTVAERCREEGELDKAEQLGTIVVEAYETWLGAEHKLTLTSQANLAVTYFQRGRWAEAVNLQTQAVLGFRTVHGEQHPDTVQCRIHLARFQRMQQLQHQPLSTNDEAIQMQET